jgi:hypothetical protein
MPLNTRLRFSWRSLWPAFVDNKATVYLLICQKLQGARRDRRQFFLTLYNLVLSTFVSYWATSGSLNNDDSAVNWILSPRWMKGESQDVTIHLLRIVYGPSCTATILTLFLPHEYLLPCFSSYAVSITWILLVFVTLIDFNVTWWSCSLNIFRKCPGEFIMEWQRYNNHFLRKWNNQKYVIITYKLTLALTFE